MRNEAAVELESGISGVIGRGIVWPAGFIPAARNVRRTHTRDGFNGAEEIVEYVAPVT